MEIPGLGVVIEDESFEAHRSRAIAVAVLGGIECEFIVQGYDDDERPEDFHAAIRAFLELDASALTAARPAIYGYYLEVRHQLGDELDVEIDGSDHVLDHIELGNEPELIRNDADGRVYVSLESECAWEPEHGLQLVFRDGALVTRVGPYDGALTD